jgi:hypothetical protein
MDNSLSSALSYGRPINEGALDLRGTGLLVGNHLRGPSPELNDEEDLADRVQQLGKALTHLTTGDTVQILFDRLEAPAPATLRHLA